MEWTGRSRPTAPSDIDLLVGHGFVEHVTGERPRIYGSPQFFEVAYAEEVE